MGIPIIGDIIGGVKDLVSEVIVDKDKRDEINVRLREIEDKANERYHEQLMGQVEINKNEALHKSLFVAGWRPFIGWVSGFGVAWQFVFSPFVETVARFAGYTGQMPALDTGQLMALVTALLGVAGYRTFEKTKGVAQESLKPTVATPDAVKPKKKKKLKLF